MVFHRRLSFHSHEHALYIERVRINLSSIFFLLDGIYISDSFSLPAIIHTPHIDDTTLTRDHTVPIYVDFALG
jgi:hypothetical protein